jgi:ABC-type branched-subunit amino acid transport system substrate-binding protein
LIRAAACGLILLLPGAAYGVAAPAVPPPVPPAVRDVVPVPRPQGGDPQRSVPPALLGRAEADYRTGRSEAALSRFLDLAYNYPDDERKGFVWLRIGEILFDQGDLREALSAAERSLRLSRARYIVLAAMDLRLRISERTRKREEARELAAHLLEQGYVHADTAELLAVMARAEAEAGRTVQALSHFGRAAVAAGTPKKAAAFRAERDALIERLEDIAAIRWTAEAEKDAAVKAHLYRVLGRVASRKGFDGMAAFALGLAARSGGPHGAAAARDLYWLEMTAASRPKIVGLVPLSGTLADIGFAVLTGAEVALRQARGPGSERQAPVLRWTDTGGEPGRARRLFREASSDDTVAGFIGPLTGEEGLSVGIAFGPSSPPVLYLGQKPIPERPFLYAFGLTPNQEARAVLAHFARSGGKDLALLFPENGYGRGFAEAVRAAAGETGVRVARALSYSPGLTDFTDVIRTLVGKKDFERQARSREKGEEIRLPLGGILIADRWDRVFQLASQLRFYNVHLPLAGFSGWNSDDLLRKAGDAMSGALFSADYNATVPGSQGDRFRAEFEEATGHPPARFEAMGYDGAKLFWNALTLGGNAAGLPVRSGLPEVWDERFSGRVSTEPRIGDLVRERLPRLGTFRGATGLFELDPYGGMRRKVFLLRIESRGFVPVPDADP